MLGGVVGGWRAQQPAAEARDNSLDVRVWWPTAAKNNYLKQTLEHGWKHPHLTHTSQYLLRGEAEKMYGSLHQAPDLLCIVPQPSAWTLLQCRWFVLLCLLPTGPLPPPQRCSCERLSCLQILCDAHKAIKRWFFAMWSFCLVLTCCSGKWEDITSHSSFLTGRMIP